jgi:flagellar hook-basal body complex protein FliE
MISGKIGEFQPPQPIAPARESAVSTPGGTASFGEALGDALRAVDAEMKSADVSATAYVGGQGGDLHNVLIEMEQADLSFRTIVQVRNKLLEAYQEIMRIQV